MKYPKHEVYESMYSKYLDEVSLKILMDLAGKDMTGKKVVDVCCGTGICTKEAIERNASKVVMLDAESDMIPATFRGSDKTPIIINKAKIALGSLSWQEDFDIAISRQAVNYWFSEVTVKSLAKCLKAGGVFVFNTFNTRPSEKPKVKQYHYQDISFTEISYVNPDDKVHHVQIRQGYPPHVAEFWWISPEKFDTILSPHFEIEKITRNRTDYYRCVKK